MKIVSVGKKKIHFGTYWINKKVYKTVQNFFEKEELYLNRKKIRKKITFFSNKPKMDWYLPQVEEIYKILQNFVLVVFVASSKWKMRGQFQRKILAYHIWNHSFKPKISQIGKLIEGKIWSSQKRWSSVDSSFAFVFKYSFDDMYKKANKSLANLIHTTLDNKITKHVSSWKLHHWTQKPFTSLKKKGQRYWETNWMIHVSTYWNTWGKFLH